ncbi:MAG TPA: AtpZ/AtpI family protein [Syntrophales bacterium]|nr:AtpZ/AtpI family protein [Syntrophales bacterium]
MAAITEKGYRSVLIMSAWGHVIVILSFLFLYVGKLLDDLAGTSPSFMLGLFLLALFVGIGKFYKEAWLKRKDV